MLTIFSLHISILKKQGNKTLMMSFLKSSLKIHRVESHIVRNIYRHKHNFTFITSKKQSKTNLVFLAKISAEMLWRQVTWWFDAPLTPSSPSAASPSSVPCSHNVHLLHWCCCWPDKNCKLQCGKRSKGSSKSIQGMMVWPCCLPATVISRN